MEIIKAHLSHVFKWKRGKTTIVWKWKGIEREAKFDLPWGRGMYTEWLKKSQRGSKNRQHRGHWVWPDPRWNSTDLQDRRSSSPSTPRLRQGNNHVKSDASIPVCYKSKAKTTCSIPYTAKWARNWRDAPCWTVMAQRTGAILWKGVGAQGCWICGSTLAEKTLQAWTLTDTHWSK